MTTRYDYKVNDLVEDKEGDKAIVREWDGEYVIIEWDCRPDHLVRIHRSLLEKANR